MASDAGKTCVTCHEWKAVTEFNRRSGAKDGLQARCRGCSRAWYERNREAHMANTGRRRRQAREAYQARLHAVFAEHPCADCGEDDVVVLEFDHLDPSTKVREVARLVNELVAWEKVEAEMAKCDVVCANCHRRRTAARAEQRRHRHQQSLERERADRALDRLRAVLPLRGPLPP